MNVCECGHEKFGTAPHIGHFGYGKGPCKHPQCQCQAFKDKTIKERNLKRPNESGYNPYPELGTGRWIPVYCGKRLVGIHDPVNQVYRTRRIRGWHYTVKHKGYGIQADTLNELERQGVQTVELDEFRTKHWFRMKKPIKAWQNTSVKDVLRNNDGEQRFLSETQLGAGERL